MKPKPTWCRKCDERTRLIDEGDIVRRCPRCHPLVEWKPA